MSRPSKRFVLPYEPEYTAHRSSRVARSGQPHRSARRWVAGRALVPCGPDNEPGLDGASARKSNPAVELGRGESFPLRR
jgi:hypothetical protein